MVPYWFSFALLLCFSAVACHPGHSSSSEARRRAEFLSQRPRTVKSCRDRDAGRSSSMLPREESHTNKRSEPVIGIPFSSHGKPIYTRRDLKVALSTDHEAKGDEELLLFADYSSYAMQPFVTPGPYFVTGELIRSDIRGGQIGIPLVLEMQFINTQTCRPMENMYIEVWQANATGVYSGVASIDNGDSLSTLGVDEEETGKRNMTGGIVNESWLRGLQQTDANGVVRFETIMPGWYVGRATHIHLLAHNPSSVERLPNNTIITLSSANHSVRASHVGQIFFDSTLIDRVADEYPYRANSQWRIKNNEDEVLMQEAITSDPIVQYVMLGKRIEDGLFGWISIGIDPRVDVEVKATASWFGSWGQMWKKLWY